jgi:protocatechuate 3,4-dioxygenase beta subunit
MTKFTYRFLLPGIVLLGMIIAIVIFLDPFKEKTERRIPSLEKRSSAECKRNFRTVNDDGAPMAELHRSSRDPHGARMELPPQRATITGRVLESDGEGRAGAQIHLRWADEESRLYGTSSAEGNFKITNLPTGPLALWAESGENRRSPCRRIVLGPGKSPAVELTLRPWFRICGRVLSLEDLSPLPGARLQAWGVGDPKLHETRTGEDGAFLLDGLLRTTYLLEAWAKGYGSRFQEDVPAGTRGVDIVLEVPGTLKGRVMDRETGSPVLHVLLEMTPVEYRLRGAGLAARSAASVFRLDCHGKRRAFEQLYERKTRQGAFRIEGLSPGRYYLAADAEGYELALVPEALSIRSGEETCVEIGMVPSRPVAGRVLDGESEEPVQGVEVRPLYTELLQEGDPLLGRRAVLTDGDGRFALETLVDRCTVLRFTHPGYRSKKINVGYWGDDLKELQFSRSDGVARQDGDVVIRLDREGEGGRIKGHVQRSLIGMDTEPALIGIQGKGGGLHTLVVDEKNEYVSGVMVPGLYTVYLMTGGRILEGRTGRVQTGMDTRIDFEEPRPHGLCLEGSVYAGPDPYVGEALVMLEGPVQGEERMRRITPLLEGAFSFFGLEAGSGELSFRPHASLGSDFKYYRDVTFGPRGHEEMRIELPATRLQIHVLDRERGAGIARAFLMMRCDPPRGRVGKMKFRGRILTLTDRTGKADLHGLPPGPYTLQVGREEYGGIMKRFEMLEYGLTVVRCEMDPL